VDGRGCQRPSLPSEEGTLENNCDRDHILHLYFSHFVVKYVKLLKILSQVEMPSLNSSDQFGKSLLDIAKTMVNHSNSVTPRHATPNVANLKTPKPEVFQSPPLTVTSPSLNESAHPGGKTSSAIGTVSKTSDPGLPNTSIQYNPAYENISERWSRALFVDICFFTFQIDKVPL
jgi:hypothetical protein